MADVRCWLLLFWCWCCAAMSLGFNLTILHTNDVHSHFIEFNVNGGRCGDNLKAQKKCYGGFPRQVTKVKEIRDQDENVVFLNGGDFYQGTVWYTLHRWQIVADAVNMLGIDAMSLGNHEFDDAIKGVVPYIKALKTQVIVCNINASKEPDFQGLVKPSTILQVGEEKIGVIGYLTPETRALSSAGELEFEDEVECIRREARRLVDEEGLNKIFAVGHSGFDVDVKIAREVAEVDVVVGGHTNTFLYSGDPPSVEEPQGPYPTVVERPDGSKALVVQDFAFGKYMGYLKVVFDESGKVVEWSGNPVLLDSTVEEDAATLELLEPYGAEVRRRGRQSLARSNVLLQGGRMTCRMRECNLGNFLADAALDFFVEQPPPDAGWNFAAVALWNSGGIRASVDERLGGGDITLEDIMSVAPFGNTMDAVLLKGRHLREVLENSVADYDLKSIDPPGAFLQVAGLRLTYNVSKPAGHRLVEAHARCANCRIPEYRPLDDEEQYWVVMASYMAKGGDGFASISQNSLGNRNTDELDLDIITKYCRKMSPVTTGLEDRVTVVSSGESVDQPEAKTDASVVSEEATVSSSLPPDVELLSGPEPSPESPTAEESAPVDATEEPPGGEEGEPSEAGIMDGINAGIESAKKVGENIATGIGQVGGKILEAGRKRIPVFRIPSPKK